MDTLLYNIGGNTNKAVDALRGVLNRAGINMTPGELNLLSIIAAEASAYQRDGSFTQKVAIERLKGYSQKDAYTAASQTLWREATGRAIEFGVPDLDLVGRGRRNQRKLAETLHSWQEQENGRNLNAEYMEKLQSIGAENTELNTIEKYEEAGYNKSKEYELLNGYSSAIAKRDISPLVGFDLYKRTNDDIQAAVVGQVASTGIEIKGFGIHFIDRVIGSVEQSRIGVKIADVLEALTSPNAEVLPVKIDEKGRPSQKFRLGKIEVSVNPETGMLIQTNPVHGKK